MSINFKNEVIIEIGKGTCFITEGKYNDKRALGFGRQGEDDPVVIISFETPESVSKFVKDITEMLKDTGA